MIRVTLGHEAGTGAWKRIEDLLGLIRKRFQGDRYGAGALGAVEADPADPERVEALATKLRGHIERDGDFHRQLEALVREMGAGTGDMVVRVEGNAQVGKMVNIQRVDGSVTL